MQPQHPGSPWSSTYGKAPDGASSKSSRGLAHGAFANTTKTRKMAIQKSAINCQAEGRPSKYPNLTVQARKYPAKIQIRTSPLDRRCRPVLCHPGHDPHPFQHTIPNTCHHPALSIHHLKGGALRTCFTKPAPTSMKQYQHNQRSFEDPPQHKNAQGTLHHLSCAP